MKKLLAVILLCVIVLAGLNFGAKASKSFNDDKEVLPVTTENNQESVENEETVKAPIPEIPQTIAIPKIGVSTVVESVGQDVQKRMDIPTDSDNVAWYNLGARPGAMGSAVIAGHRDEADGSPSVFWDLKKLVAGDKIIITDSSGKEFSFSVTDKAEYPDASFPLQKVFATIGDRPILNLITCDGAWNKTARNYSHRYVVYAELDE
jgi:sortase A